jgi:hypothetical protein
MTLGLFSSEFRNECQGDGAGSSRNEEMLVMMSIS